MYMFYQCVIVSVLFMPVAKHDAGRIDKVVDTASSCVDTCLDSLLIMVERRVSSKKTCCHG